MVLVILPESVLYGQDFGNQFESSAARQAGLLDSIHVHHQLVRRPARTTWLPGTVMGSFGIAMADV
jgi:hypothetical protein